MPDAPRCESCHNKRFFIYALLLVIALMIATVYTLIFGFIGLASNFAQKFGPNEVTCTLCEGVNEPHCVNLSKTCHKMIIGTGLDNFSMGGFSDARASAPTVG